jgi:hypothetical protein
MPKSKNQATRDQLRNRLAKYCVYDYNMKISLGENGESMDDDLQAICRLSTGNTIEAMITRNELGTILELSLIFGEDPL